MNKQMQQELQNELIITNQLLYQISIELQEIKNFTNPDGIFETNLKESASTLQELANIQKKDKLPEMKRK